MNTRIDLSFDGDVASIVLRPRPASKPPVLDHTSLGELEDVVDRIEGKSELPRILILSSESEKHFLVGASISALLQLTDETIGEWICEGHRVFNRLADLPLPVVAVVDGNSLGGGLELALACDFILAGPGARFGLPESRLGLIAGWGGAWRVAQRVGRGNARELLYSGRCIDGQRAEEIGLCDFHGSRDSIDRWIGKFIADLRELSPDSIAELKRMFVQFDLAERDRARELEARASARLMASPDTAMRLKGFFERRMNRPHTSPPEIKGVECEPSKRTSAV